MAVIAAAVVALFVAFHSVPAGAQTLYTTITQGPVEPGREMGKLYTVDPATAQATLVGALRARDGAAYVAVTAIAAHPRNGTLYGITAGARPGMRPNLVMIDPRSAEVTFVGALEHLASDITFDSTGRLFIWLTDVNQLGTVDLATGAATPLGPASSIPDGNGGGIAIDERGIAHIATTTAVGSLDRFDTRSGTRAAGPVLSGAPYLSAIRSLSFSPSGVLYGVNTNLAVPAKTALVTIDRASGVVSLVGALPDDSDGLAFSPDIVAAVKESKPRHYAYIALAVAALGAAVAVAVLKRHH
jgi:hypothetical protein